MVRFTNCFSERFGQRQGLKCGCEWVDGVREGEEKDFRELEDQVSRKTKLPRRRARQGGEKTAVNQVPNN